MYYEKTELAIESTLFSCGASAPSLLVYIPKRAFSLAPIGLKTYLHH